MLDDTLRLTIDQLFNPGYNFSKMYKSDKKNNLNLILSDFKDKINYEKHLLKTEIINQNKNDEKLEEQEKFKRMNTEIINIKDLIEKIDKTQELKNETIKNDKYNVIKKSSEFFLKLSSFWKNFITFSCSRI